MIPPVKRTIRAVPDTMYPGSAAEDLPANSTILKVICAELTPDAPFGAVGPGITTGTVSLQDRDGNAISSQVTTANHIVATWEGQSNVRTPPMVRNGEPVEVFQRSGQDKFLWRATGRGRDFRTVDSIHVEVGATDPSKPGVTKDDTNTYSAKLDSVNKIISVKTSKANGEVMAFTMQADLAAGTIVISDDSATADGKNPGNRFFMDTGAKSGTPTLQMNTSTGATLKFQGKDVLFKVPGKFMVSAGERFIIDSPLMVFNLKKAGNLIINGGSVAVNAAADFIVTAGGVVGLNTASVKISGIIIAASARLAAAVKGALGSTYKPTTITLPETGNASTPSNTADTSTTGLPYKTT